MKNKTLSFVVISLIALVGIGAIFILLVTFGLGSVFTVASSSGVQPTPVVEYDSAATGYQPIDIDYVEVEVGRGSPIPVDIVASGVWPDLCAQITEVHSRTHDFQIEVTVLAGTVESCPPDHLGLPFRFALPLNIVEMTEGTYTITVNGTSTTFDIPAK